MPNSNSYKIEVDGIEYTIKEYSPGEYVVYQDNGSVSLATSGYVFMKAFIKMAEKLSEANDLLEYEGLEQVNF
jgi:hypothetical protein